MCGSSVLATCWAGEELETQQPSPAPSSLTDTLVQKYLSLSASTSKAQQLTCHILFVRSTQKTNFCARTRNSPAHDAQVDVRIIKSSIKRHHENNLKTCRFTLERQNIPSVRVKQSSVWGKKKDPGRKKVLFLTSELQDQLQVKDEGGGGSDVMWSSSGRKWVFNSQGGRWRTGKTLLDENIYTLEH